MAGSREPCRAGRKQDGRVAVHVNEFEVSAQLRGHGALESLRVLLIAT